MIDAERKFLTQKYKCDFLLQGDKNTRLFHSLIKRNAKRNFIAALMKEDGTFTTFKHAIQRKLLQFYGSLMGSWQATNGFDGEIMDVGPKVSSKQAGLLVENVTKEDIKLSFFTLGMTNYRVRMVIHHAFSRKLGMWWGMTCLKLFWSSFLQGSCLGKSITRLLP